MIVRCYDFEVSGVNGLGNDWTVGGMMMDSFTPIDFPKLLERICEHVFQQLTQGKAVFGNPGMGCHGPYKYTRIVIELKEELED